jgi:hypothetical protein
MRVTCRNFNDVMCPWCENSSVHEKMDGDIISIFSHNKIERVKNKIFKPHDARGRRVFNPNF